MVYFPWDVGRIFWEVLNVDHGLLLRNAVQWATDEEPPVTVKGPGVLDVTVWRQRDSLTVHLVNLTNPMMMRGPFRELMPVGEQRFACDCPKARVVVHVKLLKSGETPHVEREGADLIVIVPRVVDHEVIAIDFA